MQMMEAGSSRAESSLADVASRQGSQFDQLWQRCEKLYGMLEQARLDEQAKACTDPIQGASPVTSPSPQSAGERSKSPGRFRLQDTVVSASPGSSFASAKPSSAAPIVSTASASLAAAVG